MRPGRYGDLEALSRAQSTLAEPAPALLVNTLGRDDPGSVLVAVDDGTDGVALDDRADVTVDDGRDEVAIDADPVGYLVAVPGPDAVYVPELAVRPERQRKGYGSALLSALFERTATSEVRLTVAVANDGARRFYERHGFERRERLEARFETGDGLVLVRSL